MVKALVIAEFAVGIPELDLVRERAHAFARRFLKRARGLIFEVAERAFAKFEDCWLAGQRDLSLAWLRVVVRHEVLALQRARLGAVELGEHELASRELPPPEALEAEESKFVRWRERLLGIRQELEAELKPDYVQLLACILGGSMGEAARACGITLNRAKSRARGIAKKARKILKKRAGLASGG
jgi:DNA-directed RNA polymerase specialized sigma24 family protein